MTDSEPLLKGVSTPSKIFLIFGFLDKEKLLVVRVRTKTETDHLKVLILPWKGFALRNKGLNKKKNVPNSHFVFFSIASSLAQRAISHPVSCSLFAKIFCLETCNLEGVELHYRDWKFSEGIGFLISLTCTVFTMLILS
ncbi:hypothetical protein JTE90_011201 [Oedothorax gibbosus]|uniref:Uncharacterized protein n=1 Tax=Oedothorax gibbosus TaxID=931172 RepID=A0AAV6W197_9ARAC|nr:hypothetical protein JTE90_011201 [Oedothorax gibbosus]